MGRRRSRNPLLKIVLGSLFFGFFLAGGLFATYKLATELPLAMASNHWPQVEGTVTSSKLRRKGKKHRSRLRLRYEYQVDDEAYQGTEIAFAGRIFSGSSRDRSRRYPEGKKVPVYYDPKDPKTAVLEPGVRVMGFIGTFIVAIIFVPAGLWGLKVSLKS